MKTIFTLAISLISFFGGHAYANHTKAHKASCGRVTGKKAQDIYHVLAVKEFEALGEEGAILVTKTAGSLKCQKQIIPQDPEYKTAVCVLK